MNGRGALAGAMVGVLCALTLTGPAAHAGEQDEPIHGDLNGDGLVDRVTLGYGSDSCLLLVRLGRPGGGYGPIVRYPYLPPEETVPPTYCPDMGVHLDLGGDGVPELVLGYFHGAAWGPDLVILRDYRVVGSMGAILRPSVIRTADLNADGLTDLWEMTDDLDGFQSWLNTRDGRLVPGPLAVDSMSIDEPILVDLDGNRRTDLVVSYTIGVPENGVVVVFDDGTRRQLQGGDDTWRVVVGDVSGDGRPDIRTVSWVGGVRETFINRGDRTFVLPPVAHDDRASVQRGRPQAIRVRDNDLASTNATLRVIRPPCYGRLVSTGPADIVYERTATHALPDTFVYRLSQHGRSDTATVTVRVRD
ncbi:FG-GAP repeat domain-containing protein [Plantactinospora sp. WMMC1484]|uniref:FG-GAP repeat domain-containing protein n=1 Tax=Plantactinospora sp. WMMC1484 TaxID=3404122 RepID=UPI003BF49AEC